MSSEKDPSLKVHVPVNIIRWLSYSVAFFVLLIPFWFPVWQWICGALMLGWFSSQLNELKEQIKNREVKK